MRRYRARYEEDFELDQAVLDRRRPDEQEPEEDALAVPELESFYAEALIEGEPEEIKSGKEATTYRCAAHTSAGVEYFAAKVYRARTDRSFKNDAVYQEGKVVGKRREQLAFEKKSRKGREVRFGNWLGSEYDTLQHLHAAGADVPRPVARAEGAILMEWVGDAEAAAPPLNRVTLDPHEAYPLWQQVLRNVELWLACDRVHGDLSPYNILYWGGKLIVIDFPQAVDPRSNSNALALLERDLTNVVRYWGRYGVQVDPARLARGLWGRFLNGELAAAGANADVRALD